MDKSFAPGFRFSRFDAGVLAVGATVSIGLLWVDAWIATAVAFVLAHFFLFCNVFRISRPLELLWAAVFASLVVSTVVLDVMSGAATFAVSSIATLLVLFIESRRPSYHGVGWRIVNPQLFEWWQTHRKSELEW